MPWCRPQVGEPLLEENDIKLETLDILQFIPIQIEPSSIPFEIMHYSSLFVLQVHFVDDANRPWVLVEANTVR